MPLYEYKCQSCGQVFERMQKFSDAPLTVHEGCGGKVERLLSAPALQFKGTGWYVTDYARKNGSNGKSGAHQKEAGGEKKESAPAAKDTSSSSTSASSPTNSKST